MFLDHLRLPTAPTAPPLEVRGSILKWESFGLQHGQPWSRNNDNDNDNDDDDNNNNNNNNNNSNHNNDNNNNDDSLL